MEMMIAKTMIAMGSEFVSEPTPFVIPTADIMESKLKIKSIMMI